MEFSVGTKPRKLPELSDVVELPPVSDAGQELTRHNPADAGDAHQVLNGLRQFGIFLQERRISLVPYDLLFRKFLVVEQLIEFETHRPRAL